MDQRVPPVVVLSSVVESGIYSLGMLSRAVESIVAILMLVIGQVNMRSWIDIYICVPSRRWNAVVRTAPMWCRAESWTAI